MHAEAEMKAGRGRNFIAKVRKKRLVKCHQRGPNWAY